jgi:hypothetical protein
MTYPSEIAQAIIKVKKQIKQLGVNEKNTHGGYAYVSVDKFYDHIGKLMAEAGLALLIDETSSEVKEGGKSGAPWLFAQYGLQFVHESGAIAEPLHRTLAMPISGPQTYGAAQSYIEKQFLRQVFKIPTGEKDADDTAQDDAPPPRHAGMVRAADVPPRPHVREAWSEPSTSEPPGPRPTSTAPSHTHTRNGTGNGDATMSVQQKAEAYRDAMKANFGKCKLPSDVDTLIANNTKAIEGVKKLAPEIYAEIMTMATNAKNEMYTNA